MKGPLLGQNFFGMTESGRLALLDCGVRRRRADSALNAQREKMRALHPTLFSCAAWTLYLE